MEDLAGAGARQRVLVVDARIGGFDDHITGAQLVQSSLHQPAFDLPVVFEDAVCVELVDYQLNVLVGPPYRSSGR